MNKQRTTATCATCKQPASGDRKLHACKACYTVLYCGKACQRADWKLHRPRCKTHGEHAVVLEVEPLDGDEQRLMELFRRIDLNGHELPPESPSTISPELANLNSFNSSPQDRRAGTEHQRSASGKGLYCYANDVIIFDNAVLHADICPLLNAWRRVGKGTVSAESCIPAHKKFLQGHAWCDARL